MLVNRRGFLGGLGAVLAAPAIVHAGNLMPVRSIERFLWAGPMIRMLDYQNNVLWEMPLNPVDGRLSFPPVDCAAVVDGFEVVVDGARKLSLGDRTMRFLSAGDTMQLSF